MPVIDVRGLLQFPGGDNATDTVIGDLHFNLTTLEHWNYTLYDNGTLSNGSWCLLTFEPYTPTLLYPNGSFINATWCFTPLNPIGPRAKAGLGFTAGFGLLLLCMLMNLRKHGRMYLPAEKRFWPIGRRWQWYWGIFVCGMALISLLTNVDVDRYYIVELPIVLNVFFWFIMQWGTMALVWEAVRHWGSWMERQFIDPNPFVYRMDDRRAMFEFYLPLWFYFWLWMNFFLIVPRDWGVIEMQRSPDQTAALAAPAATSGRFKAAAFCLVVCWATIFVSLRHSIKHYRPRNRGLFNRFIGFVRYTPLRFKAIMVLAAGLVAYQALAAWNFQWSPLNADTNNVAMYVGGYLPSLLILLVQSIYGWTSPNEDRELIRQRRVRGAELDRELGIVHKPAWWRRVNGDVAPAGVGERMRDRIARNVRELGGGRATARNIDQAIEARAREAETRENEAVEMGEMHRTSTNASNTRPPSFVSTYGGKSDRRRTERTVQTAASLLFPNAAPRVDRTAELTMDGPPPPYGTEAERRRNAANGSGSRLERTQSSASSASLLGPVQQVRSMLDI